MVITINLEYKIHTDEERYAWICYFLIVLLSSFIGDSFVLAASVQPGALKLNKIIVVVLQHIAVSDLILSLIHI